MSSFKYVQGQLMAEGVAVAELARQHGTPCYIYSKETLVRCWREFDDALSKHNAGHSVCYAVKACSNIAVLQVLAQLGSGFDVVSVGELERVLVAGGDASKVVFSGVGKTQTEIRTALVAGIHCFNVEVSGEIDLINTIAKSLGKIANISIRVNPDVDARTHAYITTGVADTKFGIAIAQAYHEYKYAQQFDAINIIGIDCHIGSQLTTMPPFLEVLDKVLELNAKLGQAGIHTQHIDLGGGLGICYQDELPPTPTEYVRQLLERLKGSDLKIIIEPGRAIAGKAGILLTQVQYLKPTATKNFAIVDASMNDLLRPTLYNAWQGIIPVNKNSSAASKQWDVVGPVCETADFLCKKRQLQLNQGDLLAVQETGAYGFSMSSNYNSRPRAAEIMVDGDQAQIIRKRESLSSLWHGEKILD